MCTNQIKCECVGCVWSYVIAVLCGDFPLILYENLLSTVELQLSVLIGTASHPDKQKIRIVGFFFENRLHWQFEFRLLLFAV